VITEGQVGAVGLGGHLFLLVSNEDGHLFLHFDILRK
jgi:hypothetical protein